jgi:hypothetical protein
MKIICSVDQFTMPAFPPLADLALEYAPTLMQIKPFIGTLVGVVVAIVFLASFIVCLVRSRGSSGRDRDCGTTSTNDASTAAQPMPDSELAREQCNGSVDSIEKNPDIIPQGKQNYIFPLCVLLCAIPNLPVGLVVHRG